MAHSIHDIVASINQSLENLFSPGSEVNGIGQTVLKGKEEKLPAIIGRNGEGRYVGIDDLMPIRLYHKLNSITSNSKPGHGRMPDRVNTYSLSMIVFLNRKKVKLFADEVLMMIQAAFPETISLQPYSYIRIFFNSVILNDMQVYAQEYQSDTYRLGPEHNLFQINYSVETVFKKDCFNTCPEV